MNVLRIVLITFLSLLAGGAVAQPAGSQVKDLRPEWLISSANGYVKFEGQEVQTIHFYLDAGASRGSWLQVADDEPFGLFVNQKLIVGKGGGRVILKVDSLSALYPPPLVISVFQKNKISSLSTRLLSPAPAVPDFAQNLIPRRGNYFLDFVLIAAFLLGIYLTFLMTTNPRLTVDYLNASKLFSVQEREENLLASRVTSRVNLLFYLFCCLFCSLTVVVAFHLAGDLIPLAYKFPIRTTGEGFLQWAKLLIILVSLLIVKLVIVSFFSELFGLKDVAAVQYFHFIRALILASGLIATVSMVNFIFKGQVGGLHAVLLKMGAGVLLLSAGMMYLKLLGLTRYHFFHLFSYLCASEIIPLVIVLKVLLY